MANGIIYVSAPDNVWAIDARSGRQLWRYTYPSNAGFKIGHRGVAVLGDARLCHDAGRPSRRTRRAHRHAAVECRDRRLQARLLVDQRAAHHPQPPDRRRVRRLRQSARHPQVVRTGNRRPPMDLLQYPAGRHDERGRHRRTDVDDRHLRLGVEPPLRRHRQSDSGSQWCCAKGRQQVDRQHPRAQPGHRHPRLGLPGGPARHTRLGCGGGSGAGGWHGSRRAAQAAAAGVAQRLLLRARSRHREEPADGPVCHGQLGERDRCRRTADSESGQGPGSRRTADLTG